MGLHQGFMKIVKQCFQFGRRCMIPLDSMAHTHDPSKYDSLHRNIF